MDKLIKGALIANVASLGFHWIYDSAYIKRVSKSEDILFKPQNPKHYKNAKESYLGYEGLEVGALSMQGCVLKWLYHELKNNKDFTQDDYKALLFKRMQPGGKYLGYVESYLNKMVSKEVLTKFDIHVPSYPKDDDHLVGLMPYFASKAVEKSNEYAFSLTNLFSENTDYLKLFEMFDDLFEALKNNVALKEALENSITYAPQKIINTLKEGLKTSDTNKFVRKHQLVACSIYEAIPIVYHLAFHAKSYEDGIYKNMLIGGNLSDRGALLGAILSQVYPVDSTWVKKAKLNE